MFTLTINPKQILTMKKLLFGSLLMLSFFYTHAQSCQDMIDLVKKDNYWVAYPDHLTYFNYESLLKTFNNSPKCLDSRL